MIINKHPRLLAKCAKALTLIELTVVLIVGLMVISVALVLFTNQLAAFSAMNRQNFMIREAPQINGILNSLVTRANSLQVDAVDPKITLTFVDPSDNSTTTADITFANDALTYTSGNNSWNISTSVANVAFAVDATGVLRTTLTGPNDGEITYSTTPLR